MTDTLKQPLLRISKLQGFYGETQALHNINIHVNEGEIVCLLGRRTGEILINGQPTEGLAPEAIAHLGVAWCPEERGIFASLSAEENLMLPPILKEGGLTVAEIYQLFPNLEARRKSQGSKLSGGEQQMLAIARILRTGAKLLLLDECTEGLAPVIVQKIGEVIRTLRQRGFTVLMVEQNFRFASALADRFYVIEEGAVVEQFRREDIAGRRDEIEKLLGL